jgi:DNA modification methylase
MEPHKMKIVKKQLSDLKEAPYNPRISVRDNPEFYKKLKASIDKFDLVEPIIYNIRTGNVVGGNQRLQILKDGGRTEEDCIEVDLTEDDEKALNIALNKVSGDWDPPKLNALLMDLKDLGYNNLDVTGFDDKEIGELFDQYNEPHEEVFEEPKEPKYKVNIGDVFQLGNHRLMCGDSTKKENVERLMDNKKADLLITDPPYNVNYSSKNELLNLYDKGNRVQTPIENDFQSEEQYKEFSKIWFTNCLNTLSDYNSVYIFGNYESLIGFYQLQGFVISNILIWKKNSIVLGRMDYKCQHENILYGWQNHHKWYGENNESTIIEINKPLSSKLHPTMKPLEIINKFIKNSSQIDNIIFDPFGGSGSTLIACEQTQRICRMMEIDPYYCSVIIERWETYTGKQHVQINT